MLENPRNAAELHVNSTHAPQANSARSCGKVRECVKVAGARTND
jgi:hypothetical protein